MVAERCVITLLNFADSQSDRGSFVQQREQFIVNGINLRSRIIFFFVH
jgi:hypothetical protein